MNLSFSICCLFLALRTFCLAQPGPDVFFPQKLERLTDVLGKDPDNDSLRLKRIHLFYQENKISTQFDIDYLFRKFEAGTLTIPLDAAAFHDLYGNCYAYSNPKLALFHYRKLADLQPSERVYTSLFQGYYKLQNVDTALLYYDTLIANYGFRFQKFDSDHLTFYKINLMNSSRVYNPELVQFYTDLSRMYFDKYREQRLKTDFESNYANNSLLETGFHYQFDLCAYYLRWQKPKEAKIVLEKLEKHIGKNTFGAPVERYQYHRYYFLSGTILEQEGKSKEAIKQFLYAVDYAHYTDTVWSGGLWQKYAKNPDALVLHAQTLYNKQLSDNWQVKAPNKHVLALFREAKAMGSTDYHIFLAESDHFLLLKEYQNALNAIDQAIRFSPDQSIAYEKKYTILREAYWNKFISEEELETRAKQLKEQLQPRYNNAVTSIPEI